MSGLVLRLQLFLVSYVPLLVIFAIRAFPSGDYSRSTLWPSVAWLAVALVGVGCAFWIARQARAISSIPIKVEGVEDQGSNAAAYLATYVFPFLLIGQNAWQTWAAYGVYVLVLLVVTTRSTLILINPTLYMIGRRVVLIDHQRASGSDSTNTARTLLICKHLPHVGDIVDVTELADGYIEVKGDGP